MKEIQMPYCLGEIREKQNSKILLCLNSQKNEVNPANYCINSSKF